MSSPLSLVETVGHDVFFFRPSLALALSVPEPKPCEDSDLNLNAGREAATPISRVS